MPASPQGPRKTFLLIALLLIVCYAADWTDDYYSYTVAGRESTYETANGYLSTVSGGSLDTMRMFAAATRMKSMMDGAKSGPDQRTRQSAIESVFGSAYGESSTSTRERGRFASDSSSSLDRRSALGFNARDSSLGLNGLRGGAYGASSSGFGSGGMFSSAAPD